jgi:hypothetical protein
MSRPLRKKDWTPALMDGSDNSTRGAGCCRVLESGRGREAQHRRVRNLRREIVTRERGRTVESGRRTSDAEPAAPMDAGRPRIATAHALMEGSLTVSDCRRFQHMPGNPRSRRRGAYDFLRRRVRIPASARTDPTINIVPGSGVCEPSPKNVRPSIVSGIAPRGWNPLLSFVPVRV